MVEKITVGGLMMKIRTRRYQFVFANQGAKADVESAWEQEKLEASTWTIATTKKCSKNRKIPSVYY